MGGVGEEQFGRLGRRASARESSGDEVMGNFPSGLGLVGDMDMETGGGFVADAEVERREVMVRMREIGMEGSMEGGAMAGLRDGGDAVIVGIG